MAVLGSKFDILRGWPHSSSVTEDFAIHPDAIPATRTHGHRAGEWVVLDSGSVAASRTTNAAVTSASQARPALIIEGLEDYSARMANKVTCLVGGGYVVRLSNADGYTMFDTAINGVDVTGDYVGGAAVKVVGSAISPAYRGTDGSVLGHDGSAGVLPPHNDAAIEGNDGAGEGWRTLALNILDAREAAIGHVLRYDSSEGLLEIYVE